MFLVYGHQHQGALAESFLVPIERGEDVPLFNEQEV